MSCKESFITRFSREDADRILIAANSHKNGVHDRPGSDLFRWAIVICLGFDCLTKHREYHGIRAPEADLRDWIKSSANLKEHDGDVDYLALLAGVYNDFV